LNVDTEEGVRAAWLAAHTVGAGWSGSEENVPVLIERYIKGEEHLRFGGG